MAAHFGRMQSTVRPTGGRSASGESFVIGLALSLQELANVEHDPGGVHPVVSDDVDPAQARGARDLKPLTLTSAAATDRWPHPSGDPIGKGVTGSSSRWKKDMTTMPDRKSMGLGRIRQAERQFSRFSCRASAAAAALR